LIHRLRVPLSISSLETAGRISRPSTDSQIDFHLKTSQNLFVRILGECRRHLGPLSRLGIAGIICIVCNQASSQIVPTVLSDKISKGSGTIDLLRDVSADDLQSYFGENGRLSLGADINESNDGAESRTSAGVAIREIELLISTTEGDYSFSDFYTNTTAVLTEQGSGNTGEYYTLFGDAGSSSLTPGTQDFDPTSLEDVLYIDNIVFSGEILSAEINLTFLDTQSKGGSVEDDFFDFSGGFEEFALINDPDSTAIESAARGVDNTLSFTTKAIPTAPGAPLPPLPALAVLAMLYLFLRNKRDTGQ